MLKKTRQILALLSIIMVTLLFLDFSGAAHRWLGWMARIQLLPAVLALNAAVIIALVAVTLLLGRVYCSVICPLGIMQDGFARLGRRARRNRYSYSPAHNILRYTMLGVMVIAIATGLSVVVALLAPYSAYGRIAQSLLQPLWLWGNNLLAAWAEHHDSYSFYTVDVWLRGGITLAVAVITLAVLAVLAWRNGRTYCNTICPVGTILGLLSRYSLFRPVIDTSRCNGCGSCARNCKSACINSREHTIDYSRCVACMDCIDKCRQGAISYTLRRQPAAAPAIKATGAPVKPHSKPEPEKTAVDSSRRSFMAVTATMAAAAAATAREKTVDGGLAVITDKQAPHRDTPIAPPGALSLRHLHDHCTACQLCIAACPNGVLRPSTDLSRLMQPELSFERGYCRPECNTCSSVCPTGAITAITIADRTATQVGHAVWIPANCVVLTDDVDCGNCARHCPAGAITMVSSQPGNPEARLIPTVDTERCIGCGACENLCPASPFSAIYVEGHISHRTI